MLLKEIISQIGGVELRGDPNVQIRGISYDSRAVESGSLFVAMKGEKANGMSYLAEAVRRGAAAVASQENPPEIAKIPALKVPDARRFLAEAALIFFQDPASELELVAITGTNGKTTTSYLLDSIFRQAGLKACLAGTIAMKIGDRAFPASHTTPEAPELMSFLRQAVTEGCTHGALEVSSHSLALKRVYGAGFAVGVFTNLTPEHLDFHRDMESYYRAKRLLFTPEGANQLKWAVINTDDPFGLRLASEVSIPVARYGFAAEAEIHVLSQEGRADGTRLRIATPKGELQLRSRLVGRPNIYNMMASAGAALSLGIDLETIRKGVETLSGVPGRMELIEAGQPFTVIVDFAHTPDALENLLQTVRPFSDGSLITVFGCGGDRDRTKRPVMGEIAGRMSAFVVATSDNPRSEDPVAILTEIEPGLKRTSARYRLIPDRREAIESALSLAKPGDLVVIAGKGHEDSQIIGTENYPFDDRSVTRELILRRGDAMRTKDRSELHQ
ncbi:MAG TPA: UDP-N-acetylmuramoyl-L-alanyl-D-glutamate--2,6-diaminopimelate ligase [Acidobacteriota bacterium]|nr:UDP-N-acetylmuramoyl-L-alanyl-D-glutamate--2,6-diaminopimelate ligase [Acidobacteriota bacterium]